jgi:hypothetical protein
MVPSALTDRERFQLSSFRTAARQVRDSSIIDKGHTIELVTRPGEPGYVDVFIKLLGAEPFRSLAMAIRLVYMQGEPANFLSVCNVLHRHGDEATRTRVAELRTQYQDALRDPQDGITLDDGLAPATFDAQQVFECWLYGIAFHQDPDRQDSVRRLGEAGFEFSKSFQSTALQLAGRILDLDDVVADFLGETRIARI